MTEDRVPVLKGFQAEARTLNQPTPLLDAFLQTIPERVPTAGYTKARGNIFTRYTFTQGRLKGFYIGGGANWREPTFRGNAELIGVADAPVTELWSPSYTLVSLLTGYRTRIANRPTTLALNVSNLLDKEYYRSAGVNSGSWGEPAPSGSRSSPSFDFSNHPERATHRPVHLRVGGALDAPFGGFPTAGHGRLESRPSAPSAANSEMRPIALHKVCCSQYPRRHLLGTARSAAASCSSASSSLSPR